MVQGTEMNGQFEKYNLMIVCKEEESGKGVQYAGTKEAESTGLCTGG